MGGVNWGWHAWPGLCVRACVCLREKARAGWVSRGSALTLGVGRVLPLNPFGPVRPSDSSTCRSQILEAISEQGLGKVTRLQIVGKVRICI